MKIKQKLEQSLADLEDTLEREKSSRQVNKYTI
jgi:hypothetical protein